MLKYLDEKGGPYEWCPNPLTQLRSATHMKGSPNNSTSPAKKSENAGILCDSSATDLKIGIL